QNPASVQGQVSLGAGAMPDYEGASAYVLTPYLDGELHDGPYFVRFEGGALALNLLDMGGFHAGPLVGYRLGRGDVSNGEISRMRHIRYSITGGAFAEYEHRADDPRSGERVTLSAADGTLNAQTGWTVVLRALVHRPVEFVDPGLIAAVEGDLTWADSSYMQTFFSVNPVDSAASGLPLFDAGSGMESAGVAFSLDQFLSRKWSVGLRLHYGRLVGDAAKSPVVAQGSPDQFFGALVVGYVI
ncbi:MAG: MipA/OmpV family protein, partial [Rhizomicrobium sp.]